MTTNVHNEWDRGKEVSRNQTHCTKTYIKHDDDNETN